MFVIFPVLSLPNLYQHTTTIHSSVDHLPYIMGILFFGIFNIGHIDKSLLDELKLMIDLFDVQEKHAITTPDVSMLRVSRSCVIFSYKTKPCEASKLL